jgi:hypothetical protein
VTTKPSTMSSYTDAISNLPDEAFLGSLLWFSISQADVNLELARDELTKAGLNTGTMRKILRPVDAFKKASRDVGHKFKPFGGLRSEILVRAVGEDGEQAHRHLILERAENRAGKKRRILYEKVGEVVFTRGVKKDGEYLDYGVECHRTTMNMSTPLTDEEDAWLTARLDEFGDRFDHLLHYMDSHAVRSFVRDYIDSLSGTCVKESGGLYFIKQEHAAEVAALGVWVRSIGSEFHSLPLLNLADQRQMIMEAFEDETIKEVERLMTEVQKILADPERKIEDKTFDAYGMRAADLSGKVAEYNEMLGARADRASIEISTYAKQVMQLSSRIRTAKSTTRVGTVSNGAN